MASKTNVTRYSGENVKKVRSPFRLTALLYLKEALLEERYEDCSEIVAFAYEFGARESEVEALLEDPRRSPQV